MSHWITVTNVVPMVGDKHSDKTSIPHSTDILRSKRVKIRGEPKLAPTTGKGIELFQAACKVAEIPATRRQLSKWKQRRGKAYTARMEAKKET